MLSMFHKYWLFESLKSCAWLGGGYRQTLTLNSLRPSNHLCVGKLTIIGSDNGLSPGRRQAIIWTNAGILLTGPLGTNFNEILIEIHTFPFKKMHLKMSSGKWRPFCLGLNVLTWWALGWAARAWWRYCLIGHTINLLTPGFFVWYVM